LIPVGQAQKSSPVMLSLVLLQERQPLELQSQSRQMTPGLWIDLMPQHWMERCFCFPGASTRYFVWTVFLLKSTIPVHCFLKAGYGLCLGLPRLMIQRLAPIHLLAELQLKP
jgi:hypothetical protein